MTADNPISVHNLFVNFGVIEVIRDVSFAVPRRGALAIVGDNGAGKSTILLGLAGGLSGAKMSGTIRIEGADRALSEGVVSRRLAGISIVPEREKVFSLLTVKENLRTASSGRATDTIKADDVYGFFPALADRRSTLAGNLSGGEQQMLAIGMALLGNPKVLLIDEPTLGLSVPVIEKLCETLAFIRSKLGLTVLIAESEENWISKLADTSVRLDRGTLIDSPATGVVGNLQTTKAITPTLQQPAHA